MKKLNKVIKDVADDDMKSLEKRFRDINCTLEQIRDSVNKIEFNKAYYDYFIIAGEQIDKMMCNVYEYMYNLKKEQNVKW